MSAGQPGQEANQWPGPPPAAKRKAAGVEDDFTRDDAEATPERADAARATDSPAADTASDAATPATVTGGTAPATAAPGPVDEPATLLELDHAEEFRRRWDAIKASFVDDPRAAVRRAEQLAEEVVTEVARTVDARRRDLIKRREDIGDQDDKTSTERLRIVLHGYHNVLDPVLRQ